MCTCTGKRQDYLFSRTSTSDFGLFHRPLVRALLFALVITRFRALHTLVALDGGRGIKRHFSFTFSSFIELLPPIRYTGSINIIMSSLISATEIRPIEAESVRRIVAGQAVTDLASAVKELVDNALDAGSKSINSKLKLPLIPLQALNPFLSISNDSFPSVPFLFAHSLIA
jgi:hypothetical protein